MPRALVYPELILAPAGCWNVPSSGVVRWSGLQVVQDASRVGLSLRSNYTADSFWKFTSSAVFAATVVTTIGQKPC